MAQYTCGICGFVYDEAKGIPDAGIAPGTVWADLPADWKCPLCGAPKSVFKSSEAAAPAAKEPAAVLELSGDEKELTALEMSILCSNLARGCEKQYKPREQELFTELAEYFKRGAAPAVDPNFDAIYELVEKDLNGGFDAVNAVAKEHKDRGAQRALVWSEKVSRMLDSVLARYKAEGDAMLEHTGVYVCTICGFIFVGDEPPTICPVCKVPNWKFEKVEGR